MTPELREAMGRQLEAFRRKFGRAPRPDEPVFFDPDVDTPRELEADKLQSQMIEAMVAAGVEPAKIYAYHKTGLLPTNDNLHLLSKEDIEQWKAAIAEYENVKGKPS